MHHCLALPICPFQLFQVGIHELIPDRKTFYFLKGLFITLELHLPYCRVEKERHHKGYKPGIIRMVRPSLLPISSKAVFTSRFPPAARLYDVRYQFALFFYQYLQMGWLSRA